MRRFVLAAGLASLSLLAAPPASGQHEHHPKPDTTAAATRKPSPAKKASPPHAEHAGHEAMHSGHRMTSGFSPGLPMERDGSGTSWHPDVSPMHAFHFASGDWHGMFHGSQFLRYTSQDANESGERGDDEVDGPDWGMLMAHRPIGSGGGRLLLRGMFSLDRWIEGGAGYPLLFQTGETWRNEPLIDRQHPHDLFAELAVALSQAIGDAGGAYVYFGYPGEPALGPPVFMHRPSALSNPNAPLAHHWQDATHITFGVATLGVFHRSIKAEASLFTGREPDEDRYDFDEARFDSWSGRLSVNPSPEMALQVSSGRLESPEAHEPGEDLTRTTASILFHRARGDEGIWTTTVVWGMNDPEHSDGQHSILIETDYPLGRRTNVFARLEVVEKPLLELGIGEDDPAEEEEPDLSTVRALTVGAARNLTPRRSFVLDAGGQATFYRVSRVLEEAYGSAPISIEIFLCLAPAHMAGSR